MTKISKDVSDREDFIMTLDGLAREGACRLIAAALERNLQAGMMRDRVRSWEEIARVETAHAASE